jgi:hypothetical protein
MEVDGLRLLKDAVRPTEIILQYRDQDVMHGVLEANGLVLFKIAKLKQKKGRTKLRYLCKTLTGYLSNTLGALSSIIPERYVDCPTLLEVIVYNLRWLQGPLA